MFFDIHTHKESYINSEKLFIQSIDVVSAMNLPKESFFSVGIHPWNIPNDNFDWYEYLIIKVCRHDRCIAIGECGIDYSKSINKEIQEDVFIKQVFISEKYNLPLIIHCVGAFHKVLQIKKELNPSSPWIIHGFSKSYDTALQLINAGIYLSFGNNIFDKEYQKKICKLPLDYIFAETDNDNVDISVIYSEIAEIFAIDIDEVEYRLQNNFYKLFNKFNCNKNELA